MCFNKLVVFNFAYRESIRRNFFWHNYALGWLQTIKLMNWNIPKTSMDLDLSLVLMAIFYSTFSICFIYLLFITCCLPCNFVMIDQLMMWWLKKYFQNVNISSNGKKWTKVAAKYVPFIIDIFSMWFEEFSSMKNCEKVF